VFLSERLSLLALKCDFGKHFVMNVSQDDLRKAAISSGISSEKTDLLWQALKSIEPRAEKPKFDFTNVAYYLGALIVIGAMGWFMTKAWEEFGGAGIFIIASCYTVCFVLAGRTLWNQDFRIPGGLLFTMAVCMIPLVTYGIERWTGFWPEQDPGGYTNFHPYINGSWLIMEIATVVAGLIALRFRRFPFLTAPIAYALWYMSMDLVDLLGNHQGMEWQEKQVVSCVFGGVMLLVSYLVDLRGKSDDYAFWGYLFGLMAFWGGLSSMDSDNELGKFVYCLINLGLIFCSLVLRRRTFIVFGSLGLFGYLGHLAYRVFADSILFPFALSLLGIGIICLGVLYQRKRKAVEERFRKLILPHIGSLIPKRALTE
jgi:hypothetical protein